MRIIQKKKNVKLFTPVAGGIDDWRVDTQDDLWQKGKGRLWRHGGGAALGKYRNVRALFKNDYPSLQSKWGENILLFDWF